MQEMMDLLKDHLRTVRRHRWAALLAAMVVCNAGWIAVTVLPNQYEVAAKVFFNTRSALKSLLNGLAIDSSVAEDSAKILLTTLVTRPRLEEIARKAALTDKVMSPEENTILLDNLAKDIKVSKTSSENIYDIAYSSSDPKVAHRVVEAVLDMFIQQVLGASRSDTEETKKFLDEQISHYETKLVAAERKLEDFKREHRGTMPSDGSNYFARLEQTREDLRKAKLELQEASRKRDQLESGLAASRTSLGLAGSAGPTPLDLRIQSMQNKLDEMLLQYTEKHPSVISTRRAIEELMDLKRRELGSNTATSAGTRASYLDPAYSALGLAFSNAEGELAAASARVQEYTRRLDELNKLVDTIPKVELELAGLNRDYEINKKRYEALVDRRETATVTEKAERAKETQFDIVEPPKVPLLPTGPNRPLLTSAVLLVGIGGGIGLALLMALARPTICSRKMLKSLTDLPLLGSVSLVYSPVDKARDRLANAGFLLVSSALLTTYGALMIGHNSNVDLLTKAVEVIL
ncbi:MAG: XrtA system polysaccharide chain length determinant [Gammaproteobacteria bacterium]